MDIKDLKDLEAVIKLCRKQHVDIIKIDNVEIVLGKAPAKVYVQSKASKSLDTTYDLGNIDENIQIPVEPLNIPTDELTEEQMLYGSSDPSVWQDSQ